MATANAGFYGKVPCKGDFVGRGFSQDMTNKMDAWLQCGLVYAKQALAQQWAERYMVAPIWRFYLPKNTFDSHYWMGAFIPSVDRVGRYFPLLLAVKLSHAISSCQVFASLDREFSAIENMLLESLEYDFDFDAFCLRVAQLPSLEIEHHPVAPLDQPPLNLASTHTCVHETATSSLCIWQSEGSDDIGPQLFFSDTLPEQQQFLSYFTGQTSTSAANQL